MWCVLGRRVHGPEPRERRARHPREHAVPSPTRSARAAGTRAQNRTAQRQVRPQTVAGRSALGGGDAPCLGEANERLAGNLCLETCRRRRTEAGRAVLEEAAGPVRSGGSSPEPCGSLAGPGPARRLSGFRAAFALGFETRLRGNHSPPPPPPDVLPKLPAGGRSRASASASTRAPGAPVLAAWGLGAACPLLPFGFTGRPPAHCPHSHPPHSGNTHLLQFWKVPHPACLRAPVQQVRDGPSPVFPPGTCSHQKTLPLLHLSGRGRAIRIGPAWDSPFSAGHEILNCEVFHFR